MAESFVRTLLVEDLISHRTWPAAAGSFKPVWFGGFLFQREMHTLMGGRLLWMAWFDPSMPMPNRSPRPRVCSGEQSVSGSEGHTVTAADVGWQAALLKKPFKHSESKVFSGRGKSFAGKKKRLA